MANSHSVQQSTASQTTSPDVDDAETTWLQAARGKVVRAQLQDGKKLVGQLLAFDAHTLVVQGAAPVPLLVYKHSINYLAVDETSKES